MDRIKWHAITADQAIERLSTRAQGLTASEASQRLSQYGRNAIQRRKPVSPLRLLAHQFSNFFILVLLFAAGLAYGISFLPGEHNRRLTAIFILGIILVSILLSFIEEYRAQKALQALDDLLVFKAIVVRDGSRQQVDASEVVPGDIIVLQQGQRVPADGRLIEAHNLRLDESALTGESLGVEKSPDPVGEDTPLAERSSMVYGSTHVTHGTGLAVVVSTGMSSEVGQIASTLQGMAERPTPFQVEVRKMAHQMTVIVSVLAVIIALIMLFLLHEPPIDVALNTLSLAVATIPESLPIVLTLALALGARQMATRRAVVRQLSVVESLGSVDTICTDKTGTLTQNSMTVEKLFVDGHVLTLAEGKLDQGPVSELLRAGILCNEASLNNHQADQIIGDPVDVSFLSAARSAGLDIEAERAKYPRIDLIPFSSERKMMTTVHRLPGALVAYSKGAPGAILPHCASCLNGDRVLPFEETCRQAARQAADQLQSEGMYVLALARKQAPVSNGVINPEEELTFLGLVAMLDPLRPGVSEAIAKARTAGIRVIMITGDNAHTAEEIAKQLGLGQKALEAQSLESLGPEEMRAALRDVNIVARATPQTKQQVLQALQAEGHFVAMTGDGVNDATALKQSDVGVAMGLRGTDIAKESASMVLLDDNFATMVVAIEEGRRIFDNIRKFTNYLLSTSLGEVFIVLALSVLGYFPLSAKMLLWINVVTDLVPASALAADPAVPGVMQRRPRRHSEPILNKSMYATIAGSIFRTLIVYALIFWIGLYLGGVAYARTMLFTSIVLHAFTRVLVVRQLDDLSLWSNPLLFISYAVAVGLQLLALYTPLRAIFGVLPLDWRAWLIMVPVVAGSSLAGVYMTRWILKLFPLWEA